MRLKDPFLFKSLRFSSHSPKHFGTAVVNSSWPRHAKNTLPAVNIALASVCLTSVFLLGCSLTLLWWSTLHVSLPRAVSWMSFYISVLPDFPLMKWITTHLNHWTFISIERKPASGCYSYLLGEVVDLGLEGHAGFRQSLHELRQPLLGHS